MKGVLKSTEKGWVVLIEDREISVHPSINEALSGGEINEAVMDKETLMLIFDLAVEDGVAVTFHETYYCPLCGSYPLTEDFCDWKLVAEKIGIYQK